MININEFDVIHNEIIYKCIDLNMTFQDIEGDPTILKPKMLDVVCVNGDGEIIILRDESFMFRFIRKSKIGN